MGLSKGAADFVWKKRGKWAGCFLLYD